jgi:hypothetical protein
VVVVSAGAGGGVSVLGPGVVVPGCVGERGGGGAEAVVAAVAEARDSLAAGLDRDWDHAGVGCEVLCGRVSGSVIADLSQERGGADHRFGYVNLANQPSE